MIRIRRSGDRGHFDFGWLDTFHTFSFGDYHDPAFMGFRSLRVINEDRVAPGQGFGEHPHRDMEILTYVLSGVLKHQDSMGNGSLIHPGEVQRMSAGTGVRHSEANPSSNEAVHLLQIWLLPRAKNLKPGYEQKAFALESRLNRLLLVASADGREGSVTVQQDVSLYATALAPGQSVEHGLAPGRHAWVQVARGRVGLNGEVLEAGDGAAVSEEGRLALKAEEEAEVLVFEMG